MKKFLGNPIVVVISFLVILISGEQFGGFYLMYLFIGLSHGAVYSIAGIVGIALLLLNILQSKNANRSGPKALINVAGTLSLWLSLFLFFYNDKSDYNISTFQELVPQLLMLIFIVTSIFFFFSNLLLLLRNSKNSFYRSTISK